jgi:transcriptional regulator with XRE-family HTH domain
MNPLTNYLSSHRKRLSLSQEEVAFLLGVKGLLDRDIKVSRDENATRIPSLETALAYGLIYDIPVRDLFAGLYAEVEQAVAKRAKLLGLRNSKASKRQREEVINRLISKLNR